MKQKLMGAKDFKQVKEAADVIQLLKGIENICYNYQPHEFPPLSAWESLDRLNRAIQPEDMMENYHYEMVKTVVEVCKASGVNFPLLCAHTVDMAFKILHEETALKDDNNDALPLQKYSDGDYFKLNDD